MQIRASLFLILVMLTVGSVSAQTATPTPDPSCSDVLQIIGRVIFGGACAGGQPVEIEDSMESDLYRNLATAAAIVNELPEQIDEAAPSAQNIEDAFAGASQVMGYIKWLFSENSAQEILGPDFAPLGINIMVIFTMILALTSIYIVVNVAVYVVKFATWVINQILKLLPFW
jgi:hypothetical protein